MTDDNNYLFILTGLEPEHSIIKDICTGLEEEGIPYQVRKEERNSIHLSYTAASLSIYKVGIGVSKEGNVMVHHEKLPYERPYLTGKANDGRKMGQNAARLVKGLVLK
ncbi:glycerol dehydratase reactivase beta/small subunit family protein [Alteribacillus sp. JSM 102045]|uniref:glycerol dehydratase reactivase beta/small subunit family protein n=1 Tax=Alteribacillus sp. JSM 102045 TaxID=1562101 RepID=UPI0035BF3630